MLYSASIFITLTKIRMLFCSHSSTAVTPELPGISQFKGRVVHSYSFRDPVDMQGQKVLIVGAGPSGRDIALEIVDSATEVNCGTDSLQSKYTEYSFICNIPGLFDWIKNKPCPCHDKPAVVASANVLPRIIFKIWNDKWLIFMQYQGSISQALLGNCIYLDFQISRMGLPRYTLLFRNQLTHCGLVTSYGDSDLGQHWLG